MINIKKLKEVFFDITNLDAKYKHIPLGVYVLIYCFSPVDILPEIVSDCWIFYLDDIILLITVCVSIYLDKNDLLKIHLLKDSESKSEKIHIQEILKDDITKAAESDTDNITEKEESIFTVDDNELERVTQTLFDCADTIFESETSDEGTPLW